MLSPVLADVIGPDATDKWWRLRKENVPAAKQLIAAVAGIRVYAGHRGGDASYRQGIDPGRIRLGMADRPRREPGTRVR